MMKNLNFFLSVVLSILLFSGCSSSSAQDLTTNPHSETELLMGTVVTIKIYDEDKADALEPAFERIRELDRLISSESDESDIEAINQKAGMEPVQVSDDIYPLIKKAIEYSANSDGGFDVSIGSLTSLWRIGFDDARKPEQAEIDDVLPLIGHEKVTLDDTLQTVFLEKEGMKIDLGAIAKGFISDEVLTVLEEHHVTSAVIDLGGNIYVMGLNASGEEWNVGIQNPLSTRGEVVGRILTSDQTVVTTGIYERVLDIGGEKYHHLLNPADGYPFDNNIAGVSVVTKKSIDGDALSTVIYSLGLEDGLAFIENHEDAEAIFVTKDRDVFTSSGLKGSFELLNDEFELFE